MSTGSAGIRADLDPVLMRMNGVTVHGNMPFDVPFISEIIPGIWQGGIAGRLMLPRQIRHLVSLYPHEQYRVKHPLASSLIVAMDDSAGQDLSMVDEIARWVHSCHSDGPVLVHCQAGINRSALVVARTLMLCGMTASEAISVIREKRSPACLCNKAFEEWLMT